MKIRFLIALGLLIAVAAGLAPVFTKQAPRHLLDFEDQYSVPFREGEKLVYEVNWKPLFLIPAFKAGELSLNLTNSQYRKTPTYTISARAVSDGLLSSIAGLQVRDYFESIIDRDDFRSYRFLKQTREGSRKRDVEVLFNYSGDYLLVRETDVAKNPPQELRNEKVEGLLGPLTDILSVFYVARVRDMAPGEEYFIYLSDDGKSRKVVTTVDKNETVHTNLGNFKAIKLSTKGGLFKNGGGFRIWYSQDEFRIPVKFEADVSFGKVYGELIQMEAGSVSRGLIRTQN